MAELGCLKDGKFQNLEWEGHLSVWPSGAGGDGTMSSGDDIVHFVNTKGVDVVSNQTVIGTVTAENASMSLVNASNASMTLLYATNASITHLNASHARITHHLNASNASMTHLYATNASITHHLNASNASMTNLHVSGSATTVDLYCEDAQYVKVRADTLIAQKLSADSLVVGRSFTTEGFIVTGEMSLTGGLLTTNMFSSQCDTYVSGTASMTYLNASNASMTYLNASNASMTCLNASNASMTYLNASNASSTLLSASRASASTMMAECHGRIDICTMGQLNASHASITRLNASNASLSQLNASNASMTHLNATNASITHSLRAINASMSDLNASNASMTHLNATNASITHHLNASNASMTKLNASNASLTHLNASNASIARLNASNASMTYLNASNASMSHLNASNASITHLNASNASMTYLNATNASITHHLNATNASITHHLNASNASMTKLNASNASMTKLFAPNASMTHLNASNASMTNLYATNVSMTNLYATNASITHSLSVTNASMTYLNASNASMTVLHAANASMTVLNASNASMTVLNASNASMTHLNASNSYLKNYRGKRSIMVAANPVQAATPWVYTAVPWSNISSPVASDFNFADDHIVYGFENTGPPYGYGGRVYDLRWGGFGRVADTPSTDRSWLLPLWENAMQMVPTGCATSASGETSDALYGYRMRVDDQTPRIQINLTRAHSGKTIVLNGSRSFDIELPSSGEDSEGSGLEYFFLFDYGKQAAPNTHPASADDVVDVTISIGGKEGWIGNIGDPMSSSFVSPDFVPNPVGTDKGRGGFGGALVKHNIRAGTWAGSVPATWVDNFRSGLQYKFNASGFMQAAADYLPVQTLYFDGRVRGGAGGSYIHIIGLGKGSSSSPNPIFRDAAGSTFQGAKVQSHDWFVTGTVLCELSEIEWTGVQQTNSQPPFGPTSGDGWPFTSNPTPTLINYDLRQWSLTRTSSSSRLWPTRKLYQLA